MQAIAELLVGLLVELYRELQQWWLALARLHATVPAGPSEATPSKRSSSSEVEPLVAELLVRHARSFRSGRRLVSPCEQ